MFGVVKDIQRVLGDEGLCGVAEQLPGTLMSTEIGDIEHKHKLEAEFHIEQMCKLCFRVNIQKLPESG